VALAEKERPAGAARPVAAAAAVRPPAVAARVSVEPRAAVDTQEGREVTVAWLEAEVEAEFTPTVGRVVLAAWAASVAVPAAGDAGRTW
jgi:hypothetical protein